ncbi:MAG: DUF4426 domain-containing protein [Metallibacterium scheffleri]|jgi:hypothetical protein|uniref:DUF4426 domain-containing protein n=1 Tax=Metallibacterium scheffleri TaxID=993689 RepID=UPI0026F02FDA|nr:DUF4426 domain-containing protein [Metallibacterium scheffleri]MCK9367237.1 DUF4426 domain-containing protein [Metallibacterium scheffleri]
MRACVRRVRLALAVLLLFLPLTTLHAADVVKAQGYAIYFSAVATDSIPAQVAARHGLRRAADQGVVNISVMRGPDAARGTPVAATVRGAAYTLLGKRIALNFRAVDDAGMVYYLAALHIPRPDTLRFVLAVTPAGATPIAVDFSRDFP